MREKWNHVSHPLSAEDELVTIPNTATSKKDIKNDTSKYI